MNPYGSMKGWWTILIFLILVVLGTAFLILLAGCGTAFGDTPPSNDISSTTFTITEWRCVIQYNYGDFNSDTTYYWIADPLDSTCKCEEGFRSDGVTVFQMTVSRNRIK